MNVCRYDKGATVEKPTPIWWPQRVTIALGTCQYVESRERPAVTAYVAAMIDSEPSRTVWALTPVALRPGLCHARHRSSTTTRGVSSAKAICVPRPGIIHASLTMGGPIAASHHALYRAAQGLRTAFATAQPYRIS